MTDFPTGDDMEAAFKKGTTRIQLSFDYEAKTETFRECIRRVTYGCGRQLKYIAADLDMTPAELSRKLADNPNDPVHFPAHRLPELIRATNGLDIVYWLINEFLRDKQKEREQALNQILELAPKFKLLLAALEEEKE